MAQPTSSALRALALEYKSLQEEPVEGFRVKLVNEDNMFEWEVAIFGPPDTLYQGGYFKVPCALRCLRYVRCVCVCVCVRLGARVCSRSRFSRNDAREQRDHMHALSMIILLRDNARNDRHRSFLVRSERGATRHIASRHVASCPRRTAPRRVASPCRKFVPFPRRTE